MIILLVTFFTGFSLVGCGVDMNKIKGDWIITSINGKEVIDFATASGLVEAQAMKMIIISDDLVTVKSINSNKGIVQSDNGSITVKNGMISTEINGANWLFVPTDDGKLIGIMDADGTTYEYALVKGSYDFEKKYIDQMYAGTYVVTEVNGQNVEEALKAYEATGNKLTAEELCTITISGKTFNMNAMGVKAEGTVEIDGENLKMTSDGETANATLKDGVLTLNVNGTNMVLKKK